MKRVSDWKGLQVRSIAPVKNGFAEMPIGTLYKVTNALGGLTLQSAPCKCCGMEMFIRGVHPRSVEVVTDDMLREEAAGKLYAVMHDLKTNRLPKGLPTELRDRCARFVLRAEVSLKPATCAGYRELQRATKDGAELLDEVNRVAASKAAKVSA